MSLLDKFKKASAKVADGVKGAVSELTAEEEETVTIPISEYKRLKGIESDWRGCTNIKPGKTMEPGS